MQSTLRLRTTRLALSWVFAAALAACGGGQAPVAEVTPVAKAESAAAPVAAASDTGRNAAVAELLALATPGKRALAVYQTVTANEKARRLMDFGEANFAQFFPHHAETGTWGAFRFRFYPETGVYLGVVTQPEHPWVEGGVYVMGGPFGGAPLYIAQAVDFISVVPLGFEAVPAQEKVVVTQGGSATLQVNVQRFNGLDRAIQLTLEGLPAGVSAPAVSVPPGASSAQFTLSAPADAPHSLPTAVALRASVAGLGDNGDALVEQRSINVTVRGLPGTLDTSFAGGVVTRQVGPGEDYANGMAVQADGKVVVVGSSASNAGTFIAVVRHGRDGQVDTSFGLGGSVITPVGTGNDTAAAVALQPDGRIVVAGSTDRGNGDSDFVVLRYLDNGVLDPSFGQGGKVVVPIGAETDRAYAVAIQDDGKIVVAGETQSGVSSTGLDFALIRLNANGSLDLGFGTQGKVVTPIKPFGGRDTVYALALPMVQGEQRILAVGGEGDFLAARYTAAGVLDADFGNGGKVSGLFGSNIGAARAVALLPGGRMALAGGMGNDFAAAQLHENGTLDAAFGVDGRVVLPIRNTNWDGATALVRQADGKLLLAGWAYSGNSSSADFVAVRLMAGGAPDGFFANEGVLIQPAAAGTRSDSARAIALQADERVSTVRAILAGEVNAGNNDFGILRLWL